ncbi:SpoIIE family protein phosphatase [Streptomyces sp. V3I7]|uniref:SpoIIE family protein phosphatase n=1 Tax=Streptomyces sp. V3I7 TaxID=3042278 RepID=UPI0027D88F89|nr:SpoIIE family protein phosphatase [Streptomyces sp. V3I7]
MSGDDFRDRAWSLDGEPAVGGPGGLLDLLGVAVVVTDAEGRIVLWGPGAERLFGYSAAEMLGEQATFLVIPEDLTSADSPLGQVRAGEATEGIVPARCKDGSQRRMEYRVMRLHDAEGRTLVLGLFADAETTRKVEDRLVLSDLLIHQSPIGLAVFDPQLRWLAANPALTNANGTSEQALKGRRLKDTLPLLDVEAIESAMRRVLETGEPVLDQQTVGRAPADPETDHVWSESYYRINDLRGRPLGVAVSVINVTERHQAAAELAEAHARLAIIAQASTRMGTTLDLHHTARELACAAVPELADLVAVDVLESVAAGNDTPLLPSDDGSARFCALAVASGYPTDAIDAADPVDETALYEPFRTITRSVREATPILLPRVGGAELRQIARNEEAAARFSREGVHSYLAAPLIARGQVLGTLSLYRTRNPKPFDEQDLQLACELANLAALYIDNARLYHRERDTAVTLQHSLLPEKPSRIEGMEVASQYRPARMAAEVGGDWFDVLPLSDGKVGLMVGDVMGSGVRAAAIMGQLRTTTRALARLDLPPAELLAHLDDVASTLSDSFATCVYAVVDPQDGTCTFSSAGHLPPVVARADGTCQIVTIPPAPPLGVSGMPFETLRLELPRGSVLALYTDGLVESRNAPIDAGIRALCRTLQGPPRPLKETCDTVLNTLYRHSEDDVALLLARLTELDQP